MGPDPQRKQAIERFVRGVLGCQCPDDVFRSIEAEPGPELEPGLSVRERLVIGQRLLVYLIEMNDLSDEVDYTHVTGKLVEHGVRDRDEHGLNRLRLVFGVDDSGLAAGHIQEAFQGIVLPDDRIHLHDVPSESLP